MWVKAEISEEKAARRGRPREPHLLFERRTGRHWVTARGCEAGPSRPGLAGKGQRADWARPLSDRVPIAAIR